MHGGRNEAGYPARGDRATISAASVTIALSPANHLMYRLIEQTSDCLSFLRREILHPGFLTCNSWLSIKIDYFLQLVLCYLMYY